MPVQSFRGASSTVPPSLAGSTARLVGLSGTRARGSPVPRFPEEAHGAQRTADALRTEALSILKAHPVRFPFDRPAVPSNGRAMSFLRAGMAPIEPSESAPHHRVSHGTSFLAPGSLARRRLARLIHHHQRRILCALWLVYWFLKKDFESRFGHFFHGVWCVVFIELRRFRGGARSMGPGLGARLHLGSPGDVAPTTRSFGRFHTAWEGLCLIHHHHHHQHKIIISQKPSLVL